MIEAVTLPLLNRLRGGLMRDRDSVFRHVRPWVWALLMGLVLWHLLGLGVEWLPACAVGVMLGERPGWGYPMALATGNQPAGNPEWWQFGPFLSNPFLALALRGAMWGAVPAAATLGQAMLLIPAFALSLPLGAWLGRQFDFEKNSWGSQEWFTGGLVGMFTVLGGVLCR